MSTAVFAIRKLLDRSGGAPLVAMMQPAQHRYRGDPPRRRRLNRSRGRRVLLQCQVNAVSMIIFDERLEVPVQASLIEHHHMIQTFTTNRADESLNVSTLPGRPRCRQHLFDSHRLHLLDELLPEDPIT